jgi:hypothetical protein
MLTFRRVTAVIKAMATALVVGTAEAMVVVGEDTMIKCRILEVAYGQLTGPTPD